MSNTISNNISLRTRISRFIRADILIEYILPLSLQVIAGFFLLQVLLIDQTLTVSIISNLQWPALMFFVLAFLIYPVFRLLLSLRTIFTRATKVRIMDFEWDVTDLTQAVVEREILKTGLFLASSDHVYDSTELKFLVDLSKSLGDPITELSPENKLKVVDEAIKIALADTHLHDNELRALRKIAFDLGVQRAELDDMIVDHCVFDSQLQSWPSQIDRRIQDRKVELER